MKNEFFNNRKQWLKNEISWQDKVYSLKKSVKTTKGIMEYAMRGEGDVVMALHGMPGGFDQGIMGFSWVADAGFRLLAPSRPGYLGTPLSTGVTYPEAADALVLMLDELHIDRVSVVSISGGGPPAYQFAIRHPDRINALVAIDSIALQTSMPADFNGLSSALYLSNAGQNLISYMAKKYPAIVLKGLIKDNSLLTDAEIKEQVDIAMEDPEQLRMMLRIVRSMGNFSLRKAGAENDIKQFTEMNDTQFEKVLCPTMVVHGTHDNLLFYQAVQARDEIKNSKSLWVHKGSHFCSWIHPEAKIVRKRIIEFLKEMS